MNRSLALQAKIFSAPLRRTENNVKITDKHTGKVFIMPQIEAKYLNRAKKSELKILYYIFAHAGSLDLDTLCKTLEETPETVSAALAFWRCAGVIDSEDTEESENLKGSSKAADPEKPEIPNKADAPALNAPSLVQLAPQAPTEPSQTVTVHTNAPSYSLTEIAAARDRNTEYASLVSYLEKLSGRLYNEAEQGIVLFLYDTLGIKCEVIMGVAGYCVSKGKNSIRYIQKTVMNLNEEGIHTYEELEAYLTERKAKDDYRGMVKRVLGVERAFTKPECGHIDRWEKSGVPEELVTLAYEKTVSKIGKPQIAYMSKILEGWQEKDLKTAVEVEEYFKNPDNRLLAGSGKDSGRLDFDLDDIFEKP